MGVPLTYSGVAVGMGVGGIQRSIVRRARYLPSGEAAMLIMVRGIFQCAKAFALAKAGVGLSL
jgi:hypothetical protein